MRRLFLIAFILFTGLSVNAQTTLECLKDFYINGTLPSNTNRVFTGVRVTPTGGNSTYLAYPVTTEVNGNFVRLRGNNGAVYNVDYRFTTPTFVNANSLVSWVNTCNTSNGATGGGGSVQEIQYGIGSPTFAPTGNQPRFYVDETGASYAYISNTWYYQGTIFSSTQPSVNYSYLGINYSNRYALWYNTSNNTYYKYYQNCTCWKPLGIDVSNGLNVPQFTSTQIAGLTPINGALVYNTTSNAFIVRVNGQWVNMLCCLTPAGDFNENDFNKLDFDTN